MRIGFHHIAGELWTGGAVYLGNLFAALQVLDGDRRPEIVLLAPEGSPPGQSGELGPCVDAVLPLVPPAPDGRGFGEGLLKRVRGRRASVKARLARSLREQGIAAVFARRAFGPDFDIPLLSWIPDFQHVHLPEMFSNEEVRERDRIFSAITRHADRIVVSSREALGDLKRFAVGADERARVMSFVARVPEGIYDGVAESICDSYHLPDRFVYLPNQFWRHKNHDIVLQALKIAADRGSQMTVVCTGNLTDFRNPAFPSEFFARKESMGLRNNMIILGLVPHEHVYQLMRQSLAVLQPSLFEGWNTCVEEVKSVGKRMIVSDLAVHREQDPPQAVFFDPCDPEALASCLGEAFREYTPGPDNDLETRARDAHPQRTQRFAETFMEIAEDAVDHRSPGT